MACVIRLKARLATVGLLAASCVPSGPSDSGPDATARRNAPNTNLNRPERPHKAGRLNLPRGKDKARPRPVRPTGSGAPSARAAGSAAPTPSGARPTARAAPPTAASPANAPIDKPFTDAFERPTLGPSWRPTKAVWRISGGRLCVRNARNHPVWLLKKLPVNARIEFDAVSESPEGDIKAEFWGDGKGAATGVSYNNATSYITIFGGWKNQFHVLARIDEHAKNRPEIRLSGSASDLRAQRVKQNQSYHFKVERNDGKTVRWFVDDIEILTLADPKPLKGEGHDHFAFNNWQVPVCFDNLQIVPLPGE